MVAQSGESSLSLGVTMQIVENAKEIAIKAHAGVKRKWIKTREYPDGVPYITHPERLVAAVSKLQTSDSDKEIMMAAAWLHDVLEDTDTPHDLIIEKCGIEVYYLVYQLTNPSKNLRSKDNRDLRKKLDRLHLMDVSWRAKLIKIIDRTDNLNEAAPAPNNWKAKYIMESRLLLPILLHNMPTFSETFIKNVLQLVHEFTQSVNSLEQTLPEHLRCSHQA
jgi:guanosine-3',5'-bis(diphosphate) 3'-pyrophosphohydrolase